MEATKAFLDYGIVTGSLLQFVVNMEYQVSDCTVSPSPMLSGNGTVIVYNATSAPEPLTVSVLADYSKCTNQLHLYSSNGQQGPSWLFGGIALTDVTVNIQVGYVCESFNS